MKSFELTHLQKTSSFGGMDKIIIVNFHSSKKFKEWKINEKLKKESFFPLHLTVRFFFLINRFKENKFYPVRGLFLSKNVLRKKK